MASPMKICVVRERRIFFMVVGCRLSVVGCRLSVVSSRRISATKHQPITDNHHLSVEHFAEMARDAFNHGADLYRTAQQFLQGSYSVAANAAWNDQLKVIQVGGDVEGEPVHRHPPRDANAYRRELFGAHPDAHEIAAARLRFYAEIPRRAVTHLLNVTDVAAYVLMTGRQFDDRVADQLAWAMVSHVAAATGFKKLDAQSRARRVVGQDVRAVGRAPQRDDVRVFEQQQLIRYFVALSSRDKLFLQNEGFGVRGQA